MKWIVAGLCVFTLNLMSVNVMAIEEPAYSITEKDGDIELRQYAPMIVAEVLVEGPSDKASSKGFRLIAGYIFGDNTTRLSIDEASSETPAKNQSEKISMTAPVTQTRDKSEVSEKISMTAPVTIQSNSAQSESENWRVHFVMPSQYTMQSLPKPNNDRVKLRQVPEQSYASIRFSGLAGEAKVAKKTQELIAWLNKKGFQAQGEPELARYNPPWTLPFMRRNEVLIRYTL